MGTEKKESIAFTFLAATLHFATVGDRLKNKLPSCLKFGVRSSLTGFNLRLRIFACEDLLEKVWMMFW